MIYDLELNAASHYPPRGVVDLGPEIERAGFEAFWKGEADSPDPFALLTGLAVTTRSLKLGTAIVHVHARTPVTLGVQTATLQSISRGRFWLGVGVANQRIASWHGSKLEHPLDTARAYLERVRRVAAGEKDETSFVLGWKPEHPKFPTFLAALGPKMSRLAGEVSDGAIVNMGTPAKIAEIAGHVREGARAAGKDESAAQVIAKVRVSLDPDRDRARAGLRKLAAVYTVADHYRDMLVASGFEGEVAKAIAAAREGGLRSATQAISDDYLDRLPLLAATSIEEVVDRLRPFEASGATRIIVPYVAATDTTLHEASRFLEAWRAVRSR
jgi:alkanesulfonate monooxygenase SsuD/methylene tetrahydromethanopterin reductase-like flavin-dependent oxidoreductase (luciferase family)